MTKPISRRAALRGLGTMMALPALEAMLPATSRAQGAKPGSKAVRMAFLFVPNGMNMGLWTPGGEGGSNYALAPIMESLGAHKDEFNVLSGLTQDGAFDHGDGGGDHARSAAAWLTGCHPLKTSGANIRAGVSVDQLAASKIGDLTRYPSLELGVERGGLAGDCDSGYSCAYSNAISWRSPSTPVAKETDPRLVFERLFGSADDAENAESRELRAKYNKSILDFVMDDAASLKKKLGTHDRAKLDEYFSGIREIERRISWNENANKKGGQGITLPTISTPADPGEHIRLMGDIMVVAFQADMTRICTFMLANEGSNRAYRHIGITDGHHEISHHGKDPKKLDQLQQINRFHVQQLSYIVGKMKSIKEQDGTLLDNTMLVYGGGISDPDRHNHDDLPILIAGKGGGTMKTGRHIKYKNGTPMTNLFLSMLDRVGVPAETIGDSTGRLNTLF
ncbi:MAG: DUF1552 domain-containing protein [Armatimonas sp.]